MFNVWIGKSLFCRCDSRSDADSMVRILVFCGYGFVFSAPVAL